MYYQYSTIIKYSMPILIPLTLVSQIITPSTVHLMKKKPFSIVQDTKFLLIKNKEQGRIQCINDKFKTITTVSPIKQTSGFPLHD